MNNLDQQIAQALSEAGGLPDTDNEATVIEDIASTFQGRYRGLLILAWVKMIGVTLLWMFSIYQFFYQETVKAMLAYASLAIICTISMVAIYIIFWVFMNRNMTIREIKRLELQVAILNRKLADAS